MFRFILGLCVFLSSPLLGDFSDSQVRSALEEIQVALSSYEEGEEVLLERPPLPISLDFSSRESRHYLYYYRGLGFFFHSLYYRSLKKYDDEEKSLRVAKADFQRAIFSPYAANLEEVRLWKENTQLALIDVAHRRGQFKEMTRLIYESLDRSSPELKIDLLATLKHATQKKPHNGFLKPFIEEASKKATTLNSPSVSLEKATRVLDNEVKFFYKGERSEAFKAFVKLYPKVKVKPKRTRVEKKFLELCEGHFYLFSAEDFQKIVRELWRKDQYSFALFVLKNALQVHKYHKKFPEFLYSKAKIYQEMKAYKTAEKVFKEIIEKAAGTTEHEKALFELAFNKHFYRGKEAKKEFDDYLKVYPNGSYVSSSLYHSLRYELKGKGNLSHEVKERLIAFFRRSPVSYYTFLLARDYPEVYNPILKDFLGDARKKQSSRLGGGFLPLALKGYGACFSELKEFGLYKDAESVLMKIRAQSSSYESALYLLESFRKIQKLNQVVMQAMRVFARYPESQDAWLLQETFPLFSQKFLSELLPQEKNSSLDPFLVLSLVRQESAFNEEAVSPVGAIGLMQLMPRTAKSVAKELDLENYSLQKKEDNFLLGVHYLKSLLDRFDGSIVHALGAYNAGPTTFSRWIKWGKKLHSEEFIERIPYKETSLYIKLIMRNYIAYQLLYGDPKIENVKFFF